VQGRQNEQYNIETNHFHQLARGGEMSESARERALHLQALGRLVLLLAIPVLIGAAMWMVALQVQRRALLVQHTLLVKASLERLLSNVKASESNERAFLLTGKPEFRDSYQAAENAARGEIAQLGGLIRNQQQQADLLRLRPELENYLAGLSATLARNSGTGPSAPTTAAGARAQEESTRSIESLVNEMSLDEEHLLREREAAEAAAARQLYVSLVLGYGLIVLIVASLYRSVKRYSYQSAQAEARLSALNAELDERIRQRTALLHAREELLNIFVRYVPAAVAMLDKDMCYLQVSERWCTDYGIDRDSVTGRSHYEIFPNIPDRWKLIHQRCLQGETLSAEEDIWEHHGRVAWLRWEVRPWGSRDGLPEGVLIFTEDITARKRSENDLQESEKKLRELAGSLLTAQEEERRKLARELHDDVTQQLAFLSIEIGRVAGELPPSMTETRVRMQSLQKQALRASTEVRRISHGLHPSVITDFGLSVALEEFCEEFERAHRITVNFEGAVDDAQLNDEQATCLYRIAQESVRNAAVQGRAGVVNVALLITDGQLQLRVQDNGIGFSMEQARSRTGLGVVSMFERIRLVNGTLHLSSEPGCGTTVIASMLLTEKHHGKNKDSPG
jgi:PAS domain S-box-containing protein